MENVASPKEIPTYDKYEFEGKHSDYFVAVFIINEGDKFKKQLGRMGSLKGQVDIVIADGGSDDGSTEHAFLKDAGVNTLLVKRSEGKLGTQMRMAFAWGIERGYRGVIVIDGNNKDSVESIPDFIQKLNEGYDHIQGSRFIPGGYHENTPLGRLLGVKLLHAPLLSLASGFYYTDTTNGFRAYSMKFLSDERLAVFRDIFSGYELHYYLALKAPKLGYKCIEIPVSRVYPGKGKVPTKISFFRGNLNVIKKLFAVCLGKYNMKFR